MSVDRSPDHNCVVRPQVPDFVVAETLQGDWPYLFRWKPRLNSCPISYRTCLQFVLQVLQNFTDPEDPTTIVY
jgi:hypothetical protein